jgi:hypothetical protein
MDILLARHGARLTGKGELSEHGRHHVRLAARALKLRDCTVDSCFSSASGHTVATARILQPDEEIPVRELKTLTLHGDPDDVETPIEEAARLDPDLAQQQGNQERPIARVEPHVLGIRLPAQHIELVAQRQDLHVLLPIAHRQHTEEGERVRHANVGQSQHG